MRNRTSKQDIDKLRPEYDFDYTTAERGKYYRRLLKEGSNVIVLEPDIAQAFHDSASVNEALRSLLELTRSTRRLMKHSSSREGESGLAGPIRQGALHAPDLCLACS